MSATATRACWALCVLLVGLGLSWGWCAPALTLANSALLVSYPPGAWAGRALAAAGCAAMAWLLRGRLRWLPALLALALLLAAAQRGLYLVRADADGLETRGLGGRGRLAWLAVQRVDSPPGRLNAVGLDGRVLSVSLRGWQRADAESLERTVSRRVFEASQRRAH